MQNKTSVAIANCWLPIFLVINVCAFAQVGQLNISRVQQMPNLPSPYEMRDWKNVAVDYDQLAFSITATGEHLPLVSLKPNGVNYPALSPILLQSYVGTNSNNQAEGINIIPAIVGASLVGVDKSNQDGENWVVKTKDFFNSANGQNIYLNGYSVESGSDWWYDLMPNVFFYQLYSRYPMIADFDQQFISVADQWLAATYAMGGSTTPWTTPVMNYRAWNFMTMSGNAIGVKEPEAAGSIGWLLYHAYEKTKNPKYLKGAEMAIEYLSALNSNPSYELQLPYGALIAAKMNAELGTTYDIPKLVNWCFDRGPLRGWGSIVGTWNNSDVHGLIGEANDNGDDYAFAMNGFQQVAALVPLVKYDKRFARDIAKWTLNVANASRLFYSPYLPSASQDDFAWSDANDPNGVIAYEALKQVWDGKPLYGTGDAKRNGWAQTNLGLYGSSHVGYLGSVVEQTDVDGILLLDANVTDFFQANNYPTYILYNPYVADQQVTLNLPAGSHDIYDAISETTISSNVIGTVQVTAKGGEAMLLVYIPAGSNLVVAGNKLYVDTTIIDYHSGYNFDGVFRIKSLAVADTLVEFNQQVQVHSSVENAVSGIQYTWTLDDIEIGTFAGDVFDWIVPEVPGRRVLKMQVQSDGKIAGDSIIFNVVDHIPTPPEIVSLTSDQSWYEVSTNADIACEATDMDGDVSALSYQWSVSGGTVITMDGKLLTWQAPAAEGIYELTCSVTDQDDLSVELTRQILVKVTGGEETLAFAYYPLDGDADDYSGNGRHATMTGVDPVEDVRGLPGKAFLFNAGTDIILIENSSEFNFQSEITLSFWVNLTSVSQESFILSHGSWEERWKVSVTPEKKLRWTVKNSLGTTDLDSSSPLQLDQFYHGTVVYSGYSMEMYMDGSLDTFISASGPINTTAKSVTFGRKDTGTTNYGLRGTLDEVRIYDVALNPDEIEGLMLKWNNVTDAAQAAREISVFPNPVKQDGFFIEGFEPGEISQIALHSMGGRKVPFTPTYFESRIWISLKEQPQGVLILQLHTHDKIYQSKIVCIY